MTDPLWVPGRPAKALTLTQPWATLVAIGAKRYETRSWSTAYRGPLAVHASREVDRGAALWSDTTVLAELVPAGLLTRPEMPLALEESEVKGRAPAWLARRFQTGAVVALCELVECVPTDALFRVGGALKSLERACGDFSPGRFAWELARVRALREPVPARGALGLWDWTPPDDLEERLRV